ncbi:MAG: DUF819 family protein [Draconibacterium sp.]|nr:DUF819 family protein [Draconibacterium sp.]
MDNKIPVFTDDIVVFGILMSLLGLIFYTNSLKGGFWEKFYNIIPGLLLAYVLPAVLTSTGIIANEWAIIENGKEIVHKSNLYYIASRLLLPASLILMTLSVDLKGVMNLGPKALIMFITGTLGIVIGGPIALYIVGVVSPETVIGTGHDELWRGLATLAGSWIGGGANQAAMLEVFQYNIQKYGATVLVDIFVANIWMALLLIGIGRNKKIDIWLKADTTAIEKLKEKVTKFAEKVSRVPTLSDYMVMLGITFVAVAVSFWASGFISSFLNGNVEIIKDRSSFFSALGSTFFWLVSLSTLFGIIFSFTKIRNYEGAGASKIGSVFIYILVATIGMKMDLGEILNNPGLIFIGLIWMLIHALLLIGVGKLIKAPYFFLAVGSQANVGGAASAPIVASAFHPSLASVGVMLAIVGYIVGTIAALISAGIMKYVSELLNII